MHFLLHYKGHRLGTGNTTRAGSGTQYRDDPPLPQPTYDPNLNDEARDKMRADRAAAAEARLDKMGTSKNKKKHKNTNMPLRGRSKSLLSSSKSSLISIQMINNTKNNTD